MNQITMGDEAKKYCIPGKIIGYFDASHQIKYVKVLAVEGATVTIRNLNFIERIIEWWICLHRAYISRLSWNVWGHS